MRRIIFILFALLASTGALAREQDDYLNVKVTTVYGETAWLGIPGIIDGTNFYVGRVHSPTLILGGIVWNACITEDRVRSVDLNEVWSGKGTGTHYNVTSIGRNAFQNCSFLTSIKIPASVTSVGINAFQSCSGLTSIEIPSGVTSIGDEAFAGCSGLTSIEIPSSVISIGNHAFSACSGLKEIKVQEGNTKYDSRDNCNAIIETESNKLISACNNTVIPGSVTSIVKYAFYGCPGLTSIEIPSGVTSIEQGAIADCINMAGIKVQEGNPKYDSRDNCNAIIETASNTLVAGCKSTKIPTTVTSIGAEAFFGSGITIHTIPENITSIGDFAFWGCPNIVSITIPDREIYYGDRPFGNCPNLESVISKHDPGDTYYENSLFSDETYRTNATLYVPQKYFYEGAQDWWVFGGAFKKIVGFEESDSLEWTPLGKGYITDGAISAAFGYGPEMMSIDIEKAETSTGMRIRFVSPYNKILGADDMADENGAYPANNLNESKANLTTTDDIVWEFDINKNGTVQLVPRSWDLGLNYGYGAMSLFHHLTNCSGQAYMEDGIITFPANCLVLWTENKGMYNCRPFLIYTNTEAYKNRQAIIPTITSEENMTVEVVGRKKACVGRISIPESIVIGGKTYHVTSIGDDAFSGCSSLTSIEIPGSVTGIGRFAFNGCTGLTSIEIPSSVTGIGTAAFYGCSGLTSIKLQDGLTSIEDWMFEGCSNLTSIEIPGSVTSLGWRAFYGCTGLTSIEIPSSVTGIGTAAFYGCTGLTSIEIPSSVTSIGYDTFWGCDGIAKIKVQEGNTKYDSRNNCNGIIETASNTLVIGCKNTVISETVTSIGGRAFQGCSGLTSIKLPSSVMNIGHDAFSGCTGLTSIEIPSHVTSIADYSFFGCNNLKDVYCRAITPPSAEEEGEAFTNFTATLHVPTGSKEAYQNADLWKNFTNIVEDLVPVCELIYNIISEKDATVEVVAANRTYIGNVIIPETVELDGKTYHVTSVREDAFRYCTGLTSIEIPNGVTIPKNAFYDCDNLKDVYCRATTPPSTVEFWAFGRPSATLHVPTGTRNVYQSSEVWGIFKHIVDDIDIELVYNFFNVTSKENLTVEVVAASGKYGGKIIIPEKTLIDGKTYNVTSIGDYAFYGCSGLTSIVIPNGVTSIGAFAFFDCGGLTSIKLPNGVTRIGSQAFSYCHDLTSIELPSSVTSIGESAFFGCSGLTEIKVQEGNTMFDSRDNCNAIIETASNKLFLGCKNTVIPETVTSIGVGAFLNCSGLTSIVIPNSVTSIERGVFSGCTDLTSIELPNSVTGIGKYAFLSCSGLTSIEIPNSVTSIEEGVFSYCTDLTSIEIPSSVTSIGDFAFYQCDNIKSIYCKATTPPSADEDASFTNFSATLHVPVGTKKDYQKAAIWKNFTNIVEDIIPDGIKSIKAERSEGIRYNLRGQRIEQPKKGEIYIENGRKRLAR